MRKQAVTTDYIPGNSLFNTFVLVPSNIPDFLSDRFRLRVFFVRM
jgi:hypothetical protein